MTKSLDTPGGPQELTALIVPQRGRSCPANRRRLLRFLPEQLDFPDLLEDFADKMQLGFVNELVAIRRLPAEQLAQRHAETIRSKRRSTAICRRRPSTRKVRYRPSGVVRFGRRRW